MEQFDQKETYLEQLKMQIHCKKARNMVTAELSQHIEDQKMSYIKEGADENAAMVKALEQMGDPIEVGKQLNKIHKPRLEWRILLVVLMLCCFGVFAQISIQHSIDESMLFNPIDIGRHIGFLIMGFGIMVIVYFLDYSIIGRYPKLIWFLFIAILVIYSHFGRRVNGSVPYMYAAGMLFIPIYGGILYAYRDKGYTGIVKCLLFSIVTGMLEMRFTPPCLVYLGLLLSSLIMLSIAVSKNWFGTVKKIGMAVLWGWIPLSILALKLLNIAVFRQYQMERFHSMIRIMLHPERYDQGYQMNIIRQIITHSKLFGGSTEYIEGYLPSLSSDNILTYVIGKWGIAAGVLIAGLFAILLGRMFYISCHQKNPLGMFVGIGCSLVFAIQGGTYIISNLSLQLIAQINLPFVSYGGSGLFVNFIILGILLSVFRNTAIIKEVPYKERLPLRFTLKEQ